MPKASNPPPAEKEATLSVNRNYEALLDKKVWYVRNKHTKGAWSPANRAAAKVCADLKDGKIEASASLHIVV